ncbi:MAG: hypothetical protein Q9194_001925 [Teloschistes cf. exilis]
MFPSTFDAGEDGTSSPITSGPSGFGTQRDQSISGMTPGGQTRGFHPSPRTHGEHSQRNHVLYQADNNGSPNRYVDQSSDFHPNDMGSASRSHRPEPLGFGIIGDGPRANDQQIGAGPKSAPAHVKSFGQFANNDGQQGSSQNLFEDRWLQHPEESPDATAMRHSATFTDLLHAQLSSTYFNETGSRGLGPLGVHSASHAHTIRSSSISPGQNSSVSSQPNVGRGHESLLEKYVAMSGEIGPEYRVKELDRLMKALLVLRRDGTTLPLMTHPDRDQLRQQIYESVLGNTDGRSDLSLANPLGLINVAEVLVTRQHLHDEIIQCIEDQLDMMPPHYHNDRQFRAAADVVERQENNTGRASLEPPPSSNVQGHGQTSRLMSPAPEFQGLNLEGPHPTMAGPSIRQPLTNMGMAPVHHFPLPQQVQFNPFAQNFSPGAPGFNPVHHGQPPMELQQQNYIAYLQLQQQQQAQQSHSYPPNLVISRNGMVPGPNTLMAPAVTFVPGRQGMGQHGPFLPYGPQFFSGNTFPGPHFPGPMLPGNFMPNPQMLLGAFPPNLDGWSAPRMQRGLTRESLLGSPMQFPSSRGSSPAIHSRRHVVPERAPLPYRPGSDDMYPVSGGGTSVKRQELARRGQSCIEALKPEYLPFVENAREAKVAEWGVMKISNIPYSVTKQEVYGLLGRNAKIVTPELGVGIHIIMERPTGKTQDCFVEFFSYGDALASFNRCLARGQNLRMGDRVVTVAMSSQDDLMKEMFPKAKNCTWRDGRPIITESADPYNSGFKSFLTNEELLQMATHADKPHRKCLQRPFECMISTLAKVSSSSTLMLPYTRSLMLNQFPWFAVDCYTLKTRDEIFRQTLNLTTILANQLNRGNEGFEHNLSESLLTELLYAGLNAPAFSEQQRWQLCRAAHPVDQKIRMSPMAPYWPFQVLGRKAGMDEDVVKVGKQ